MKYLIACLGNIGAEYDNTRHNSGFKIADRLAKDLEASFATGRLAQTSEMKYRGRTLIVIKPTTYMNLSFPLGHQIDYVLGQWKPSEVPIVDETVDKAVEAIKSFVTQGPDRTMNQYN